MRFLKRSFINNNNKNLPELAEYLNGEIFHDNIFHDDYAFNVLLLLSSEMILSRIASCIRIYVDIVRILGI